MYYRNSLISSIMSPNIFLSSVSKKLHYVKVELLSLCLTKYHPMKTYGGVETTSTHS